ncbi:hypothetical protein OS493_021758 [Desmophyllum pertusum]|uniref:Immunoglobulin domain-containing protein n=1 Tax=Desmophyllum pertusum TaxID=174260 RepID=A0A9X0D835_9CNID|nr:hypothetical protein OS493_021758 [Desmophyllum pertusum]
MKDCSNGEVLFCLVCLMLLSVLSSVESFNWTAQPTNPTPAIKGQDVSLTWNYSLTADELLKTKTYFIIAWKNSDYGIDNIASKFFIRGAVNVGNLGYTEPQLPHIVVDRNDPATLHIKDVRREDEGTYKIEFTLTSFGNIIAEQEVNLTVLGKF